MSDSQEVPLATIRAALSEDVKRRGLRSLARAVGMSPTGLDKFLSVNRRVYSTTESRLRDWFFQRGAESAVDEEIAHTALDVLLAEVPPGKVLDTARRAVLDAVEKAHRASKREAPEWVSKLREGRTAGLTAL